MKKTLLAGLAVGVMMFGMVGIAQAASIVLTPNDYVYDETTPRAIEGDAAPGWGTGSLQGPSTGKSNFHLMYDNELVDLFGVGHNLSVGDLQGISFWTKSTDHNWWITIYTQHQGDGNDSGSWYDSRLHAYPGNDLTGTWTQWSTGVSGQLEFHDSQRGGGYYSLTSLAAGGGLQDYSAELIRMITIQSDSGWNGFGGQIDGLTITTSKGTGSVNFEATAPVPEPATMLLMGTGLVGLIGARRKKKA